MPVTTTPKTRHNANGRRHASTRLQTIMPESLVLRLATPLLRQRRGFSLRSVVLPVVEDTTTPKTRHNANGRRRTFTRLQTIMPKLPALRLAARLLRRQQGSLPQTVVLPVMMQDMTTPKTRQNANRRRRTFTRLQTIMPESLVLRLTTPLLRQRRGFSLRSVVLPVVEDTTTPKTRHNANRRRRTFTRLQTIMPESLVLRLAVRLLRQRRDSLPQAVVLPVMMQDTTTPKTRQNANRRRRTFTRLQTIMPESLVLRLTTPLLRQRRGFSLRSVVLPVVEDTTTPKTRHNANGRRRNFTRLQIIMPKLPALRLAARLLRRQQGSLPQTVVLPVMMQDMTTPKTRQNANRRRRTFTRLQTIMPESLVLRLAVRLLRQRRDSLPQAVVVMMQDTTTPKTRQNANRRRRTFTRLQTIMPESLVLRLTTPLLRQRRGALPQTLVLPVVEDTTTPKTRQNANRRRRTFTRLQTIMPESLVLRLAVRLLRQRRDSLPQAVVLPVMMQDTTTPKTRQNANRRRRTFTRLQTIMPESLVLRLAVRLLRQRRDSLPQAVVLPVMMQDTTTPKTRQNANRRRRTFTRLQTIMPESLVLRLAVRLLRQRRDSLPQAVVLPVMMQDTTTPKTRQNANRRRRTFTRLQTIMPEPLVLRLATPLLRQRQGALP